MQLRGEWLERAATQAVLRIASGADGPALIVGGSVRNAVQGRPVSDLDIATPMRPEDVMSRARKAGLKAIPTGIDHGTVTVVADGIAHEVTTFRRDVETTGRHATVAFSTDIAQDAARRDFTMNALYASADGQVIDPLGGLADALAGRVRFIGQARDRIAEDYLRILRFFRFTAIYASGPADAEGLAACADLRAGLAQLSMERITAEMCKLLGADAPARALAEMADSGVLEAVLPMAQTGFMPALERAEAVVQAAPHWPRRMLALGGNSAAWRLSCAERRALQMAEKGLSRTAPAAERAYRAGAQIALDVTLVEAAMIGATIGAMPDIADIARGAAARFPLNGADLMPPYSGGRALGAELARLEAEWIAADFAADRTALLAMMRPPVL